ncbi:hypothetical protein EDC94DRAFT_590906 [Helicostylum pulchrum]|nr:hypothetical protein EDC94DRAFT_590906 [Helicostylum pulchrum]
MWRQKRHTHYRMIPERLNFRYTAIKKQCPILLTFQVALLLINNNVKATTVFHIKKNLAGIPKIEFYKAPLAPKLFQILYERKGSFSKYLDNLIKQNMYRDAY